MRRFEGREWMDEPGFPRSELAPAYAGIERLSRLTGMRDQVLEAFLLLLGPPSPRRLRMVELGAGSGWLSAWLEEQLRLRGFKAEIQATDLKKSPGVSAADCLKAASLPKADYYFSSLVLHHLKAEEVRKTLALQAGKALKGFLHFDLERSFLHLAGAFPLLSLMPGLHRANRIDGLLSIRRAWRVEEMRELAPKGAELRRLWPFRFVLTWKK